MAAEVGERERAVAREATRHLRARGDSDEAAWTVASRCRAASPALAGA